MSTSLLSDISELLNRLEGMNCGGGVNEMNGQDMIDIIDVLTRARHCVSVHSLSASYKPPSIVMPNGETIEIAGVSPGMFEISIFTQQSHYKSYIRRIQIDGEHDLIRRTATPEDDPVIEDDGGSWTPWATCEDESLNTALDKFGVDDDSFYTLMDLLSTLDDPSRWPH